MNKAWIALVAVIVIAAGGYAAWVWQGSPPIADMLPRNDAVNTVAGESITGNDNGTDAAGAPVSGAGDSQTVPILAASRIAAEAVIVPVQYAALSMAATGIVEEVVAAEGQQLEQGDLIARLQSDNEVIAVAQAQAAVSSARAMVDKLIAGARPEEIATAQAAVDAAQAQLEILRQGARAEDVAALQAALAQAQAGYAAVAEGADDQALIAAQADLANAQATLTQTRRAYDQVSWRSDVGALPEAQALQVATNAVEAAQARYDLLLEGARPSAFAQAAALVNQARAQLERAQAPPTENEIAAAEAEVRRAQAQLDLIAAGTRAEDILVAQAELARTETVLMQAQLLLADRELRAPFAGTLAALDLKVGQQVAAGSVPVAQLGDTASWLVETTDLTEIDIVNVEIGDTAVIAVDALPDTELTGTVIGIKPLGENVLGDITYKVTIALEEGDPRLRWSMTASASILP